MPAPQSPRRPGMPSHVRRARSSRGSIGTPLLIIGVIVLGLGLPLVLPVTKFLGLLQGKPRATPTPTMPVVVTPTPSFIPTPTPFNGSTPWIPSSPTPDPNQGPQLPADAWNKSTGTINLRQGAGRTYDLVPPGIKIPANAMVRVLEIQNDWGKVSYTDPTGKKYDGYVSMQYFTFDAPQTATATPKPSSSPKPSISPSPTPAASLQVGDAWNKGSGTINLRAEPVINSSNIVVKIPAKAKVNIIQVGEWCKVGYVGGDGNSYSGFVLGNLLTNTKP